MAVSMNYVDRCVPVIRIVLVTKDVNEDPASPYVVAMMTVEMVKFAKVLSARLDVVRTTTVPIICHASINNVSIHVSEVLPVEQMLNVVASIIKSNVHVLRHSSVTQLLVVNSQLPFVASTMIVHRITLAMEMYVNLHAEAIKIVYLTNDAYVEFVEPFAIVTLPVAKDKYAKIVCVKPDAEVTTFAQVIKLVSIISVRIHAQQPANVVRVQNVLLSIMAFNAVARLVSLETL